MHRIILLLAMTLSASGCQHLHWPHAQTVPPPAENAAACPPCELGANPCDPCYTGEYVLMDPDGAYVMPGTVVPGPEYVVPNPPMAGAPPFPPSTAPLPPPGAGQTGAGQTELPGWFDVLPTGSAAISPDFGLPRGPVVENPLPNPLVVPINNSELAWDQLVDVVSTYFPVSREQPVQLNDGILTEGFIETPPQAGATLFEPFRKDSAGRFNRWQSTLQSIRRRALIRVAPTAGGWAIEPQVFKELEDLPAPEYATASRAMFQSSNSLSTDRLEDVSLTRESAYWIPLGRDAPLEQKMLREIQQRLTTGK